MDLPPLVKIYVSYRSLGLASTHGSMATFFVSFLVLSFFPHPSSLHNFVPPSCQRCPFFLPLGHCWENRSLSATLFFHGTYLIRAINTNFLEFSVHDTPTFQTPPFNLRLTYEGRVEYILETYGMVFWTSWKAWKIQSINVSI